MLIACLTDTHSGTRNDQLYFHDNIAKFYSETFFPYLDEHNIKHFIHLGDMVDRRKYINYHTANRLRTDFLDPLAKRNIESHFIVGNHDLYFKNTMNLHAHKELIQDKYPF